MVRANDSAKTQKILQELLGLEYITDKIELKNAIISKIDSLNKIEKQTLNLKLGLRLKEEEQGDDYKKRKPILIFVASLFNLILSIVCFFVLFNYDLSIYWRIILCVFAILWAIIGLRGLYKQFMIKK